jgi:site-specific DNA-cytosine methylase
MHPWAQALHSHGLRCTALDLKYFPTHDILNPDLQQLILHSIESGYVKYLHVAPPCSSFSIARFPKLRLVTQQF